MAYRTRRVFRDQFQVLALLSQLEHLQRQAASADSRRRKWGSRRAQRRLAAVSNELAGVVHGSVLSDVADEDLLPRVREYLDAHPSPGEIHEKRNTGRRAIAIVTTCLCGVAWMATLADVALHGVTNRTSLNVGDWTALALTAIACVLWIRD